VFTIDNLDKSKPWLDFSSLSIFMKCPRAYQWRMIKEITTSGCKAALINGEAYHEAIATYHRSKLAGASHDEAKELGLRAMVPIMKLIKVEDDKRNLTVAFSTVDNYFEFWKDEACTVEQVEVSFAVDMMDFLYVGRIDSIKRSPVFGQLVNETKTTSIVGKKWSERTNPNMQIDGYIAAIYITTGNRPDGGILDVIPVDAKLKEKPFRFITTRTEEDIDTWARDIQSWYKSIELCHDMNYFPRHGDPLNSCVPVLGYSCDYVTLCRMYPRIPEGEIEIPSEYMIESWAPFQELKKGDLE
jgi:PD-(D/E)XK nuclease superfamily